MCAHALGPDLLVHVHVFFLFFLFLGYRGGLFSGPQSLPIPRQVHMCFISRQACLLNCKFQRRCWPGDTLGPEVEADRRKQKTGTEGITSLCFVFFLSSAESEKELGILFPLFGPPPPPAPPSLPPLFLSRYLRLITASFLPAKLVYSSSNSASARCCARKFLWTFFFYVSVSLLSSSSLVFFFFAATNPIPPTTPPTLFSLSSDSVCAGCPGLVPVYVPALRYCVCRREERGGEKRSHNSKHLGRRELCLKQWFPFASGQKCSLVFFFFFLSYSSSSPPPRHSHTPDTDTLSSTHITAAPAPTTKIYVSSLIFQSLSSPST